MGVVSSFLSTYILTWKIYLSSWIKDWKAQKKHISQLRLNFEKIPNIISNLMWNVLMFTLMQSLLIHFAGFTIEFQAFCYKFVVLPNLVGSIMYYCYKYGTREVLLESLSVPTFMSWLKNWIVMHGIAFVHITQTAVVYFVGIYVQPHILPSSWNLSVRFPTDLYEESLRVSVYYFMVLFLICILTLPLWKHGYKLSMDAAGRSNVSISYTEVFLELLYQTSQHGAILFVVTPILVLLQNYLGFRIYTMHVIFAGIEVVLINYVVQYKFCIIHQLMHEIQPLYTMTHIEHHICKSIHPTTSAVGLWENWVAGQAIFFTTFIGLAPIPYVVLQAIYMGANIVVHTMWPSQLLLQWHTLHHTILADVYNVNIPSPYDKENSITVHKLQTKLTKVSPFIAKEALSDIAGFVLLGIVGLILHYGFGVGVGHVDWTNRPDWIYHSQTI